MDIEFCCCFCCCFKFNNFGIHFALVWHRAIDNFFPSLTAAVTAVAVPLLLVEFSFFLLLLLLLLLLLIHENTVMDHKNCAHRNQQPNGPNEFIGMVRKIKLVSA